MLAASAASVPCRLVSAGRVWLCDDDLGVSRGPSYALAHDARGYLWIGSEHGPARFDGLAWEAPASLAPLGACIVRGFAEAPDGLLWIGTDNAGVACIDRDTTPYRITARLTVADGLPSDTVGAVCVDGEGQAWAATTGGVALIRDGRVRRCFTTADGLPSERAWTICRDHHDRIWVGTKEGLALIDGEAVTPVITTGADGDPRGVHVVCRDARGHILIGLMGGAVCRVVETETAAGTGWALETLAETGARVRALCPDPEGRLWIGTSAGVLVLHDGVVVDAWDIADGLPVQGVWALCRDREGRAWASTSAGLALIAQPTPPARPLPPATGAPQGLVFACQPDGQGRVWIASEQGLVAVDEDGVRLAALPPLPDAVAGQMVWALRLDGHGHVWVGTDRSGLLCLDPATGAVLAQLSVTSRVPALCLQGDRYLWASVAGEGLLCVDVDTRQVVHRVGRAEGLPHDVVYGLHADGEGQLWAGTWSGELACLDARRGTVVATLTLNDAHAQRPVIDLVGDARRGRLWAATYGGGLVCVDPARRVVTGIETTREGAPSDILYACLVDPHGDLWLGTTRGVARYRPEDARWSVVGRGLGLPSEECNARALYLDRCAQLWVGTVGGVGVVATERVSADIPPCPVYLTSLTVMGVERALTPDLEIEDSDYDLLFGYGAVAFTGAAQVVYRAQLEGLEAAWPAPTTQRTARYTNLRPGAYTFRVAARDWSGRWSAPVEVPFRVIRNRKAQEMDDALTRERIDKEVALATAAVFERLALQDGLTGLLNRRALDERLAQEVERARRHGHPLAVALGDIDHFKRINDTYGHLTGDEVLKAVARLCQATARGEDSIGRYGGEEIAVILPETAATEGAAVCERLRQAIEDYDWTSIAAGLRVTLSIGLSGASDAPQPAALLAAADTQLYQAKQGGRNRVACAAYTPRSHPPVSSAPLADPPPVPSAPSTDPPPVPSTDPPPVPSTDPPPAPPAEPAGAEVWGAVDRAAPPVLTDPLTGLGSHRAFHEALRRAVGQAIVRGEGLTLARLDLDRFKALNDQHGPGYGDGVLGALAAALGRGRGEDRAFRLGGDEFALLLPRAGLPEAVAALERLRVAATRDLRGATVSVGVADLSAVSSGVGAPEGEGLLDGAEAALAVAKRRGGNVVVTVDAVQDGAALTASAQSRALRRLLTEEQVAVAFQPIWDLTAGRVLAFEAFARPAATYGFAGPQDAFDVAERAGQAHAFDTLCRRTILARAAALPATTLLFLNVSPQTLDHDLLAGTALRDEVAAAGLTPGRVVLEITERLVARPGVVMREAARLRALGFRLALDDAGAGNAGLEMLSAVPVDFVKVDRGVVARACTTTAARGVLAGILAIARETGAYVIAEGIETVEMLAFVRQAGGGAGPRGGIHGVQGYLLGRPREMLPDRAEAALLRALIDAA